MKINDSHSRVVFTTPEMRTLVFENPPNAYPINRYQSLLLANSAHLEAIEVSQRSGRPLQTMRAVEICCGGGPAAIALKDLGLGFVGASDIQADSIAQLRNNASLNNLVLDSLRVGAGLTQWLTDQPWLDVIACNPPCLPSKLIDQRLPQSLRTAMQGGAGGTELLVEVLNSLDQILTAFGRFAFVMTSMMDFRSIEVFMTVRFAGRWRVSPGTPIAAPYCRADGPIAARLLQMRDAGEVFIWLGDDGWIWRLTWIATVVGSEDKINSAYAHFSFYPFGYGPVAEDYFVALEIFDCPRPANPMPQMLCL